MMYYYILKRIVGGVIVKFRQIGLGTKIELDLYNEKGERTVTGLASQFESYDEDTNLMEIHVPFLQGKIYTVHPGTRADIYFAKENDVYMFTAEIIDRKFIEPIPMMWVKPISRIEKIERRSFFRMDCELPVRYYVMDNDDESEEKPFIECYTKDISGGGICIITDKFHEKGTKIKAYIKLEQEICFIGTVVRSRQIRERGRTRYETGVEYKQIENRNREKIIGFIFETQRERIKKGWMMT